MFDRRISRDAKFLRAAWGLPFESNFSELHPQPAVTADSCSGTGASLWEGQAIPPYLKSLNVAEG